MEEKNKVFVFDKKEVILIFIFMVVLTTISFTLGIRFGKTISLKNDGFFETDRQEIEIKSVKEEYVDELVNENSENSDELSPSDTVKNDESSNEEMISKLKEEFENLEKKSFKTDVPPVEPVEEKTTSEVLGEQSQNKISEKIVTTSELLKGKYTIQVGSYNLKEDAMKFAEAFSAMGYQPILHEVNIKNKGIWHRVSIGAFNNMAEAKEFLEKEKSVFADKDYFIAEIE